MDILECKLKNCYGIDEFNHEFDFTNTNVITVYAKNGLMKTSFAKLLRKFKMVKLTKYVMKYSI